MKWTDHAEALADTVTHTASRWHGPVATTPRHAFVPRWWHRAPEGWTLNDGEADPQRWLDTAYSDRSLVTSVGPMHADHAKPDDHPRGLPTSSSTLPSLVVRMFQHAHLDDGHDLADIGTGSGYGAALATRRLGERHVTSLDVDPYLVIAARDRLAEIGLRPTVAAYDATEHLPGTFDRIVATVAVRPVPTAWLTALRPGGRLVTTIAGTSLIVTADKDDEGGATGRVEWDRAGFMTTRHGSDYPPGVGALLEAARTRDADTEYGYYPVVDVANAWDLASMLDLTTPGIEHRYEDNDGQRTALMAHADGSWARATGRGGERPDVTQGGPRRLWDLLDELRAHWLSEGELPVRGAKVFIRPDGTTIIARGKWHVKLTA
ncbi:methyltransferase domain-containing protein [Streptomyces umbrinus]|uniref:methyltransferase domain-containing protein n=1 Tax=Streptomyces umbrinus TaxID=67370 RepID=UPI003C2D9E64